MIEGMSQETFDENRTAIATVVKLLLDNSKSRERHRRLIVHERANNDVLVEVLNTPHGPVVLYRGVEWSEVNGDFIAFRQARGRDNWLLAPLPADGDDQWLSQTFSRVSPPYDLASDDLRRWIAEGRREVSLPL